MKLVIFLPFLLLPVLVGSAAASVAAALPSTGAAPLFAWVPLGGYPDHFPFGQCTWWAAYNHRVSWGGDARDWIANASAQGIRVEGMPSVGAIVSYRPSGAYSTLGHIAIVVAASSRASSRDRGPLLSTSIRGPRGRLPRWTRSGNAP